MTEVVAHAVPPSTESKGLRAGSLGMVSSVVIGTASTAPAYSIAATLGLLVIAGTGFQAASFVLFAFVPVMFVALAFRELNSAEPDCGTNFTWATRAFGSKVGWMSGWVVTIAQLLAMTSQSAISGKYTLLLFGAGDLADNKYATMGVGLAWLVLLCWICYRGIEVSAKLQWVLLAVELAVLVIFAVVALYRVADGTAGPQASTPSLSWLLPTGIGAGAFIAATLPAVFLYWGWDSSVSVNEESADPRRGPGKAAVLSTVLLVLNYVIVTIAALAFAGIGPTGIGLGNPDNSDDVLAGLGSAVFGDGSFGKIMGVLLVVSVLTSAAASSQATIMPCARTTLSMAAHGALPEVFARVHPRYLTPTVSTWAFGIVSFALYVLLSLLSDNVLADSVSAVGLCIGVEYAVTALACVWIFRRTLFSSVRNFVMRGLLPLVGGLFFAMVLVLAVVYYAQPDSGATTIFGIGGVAVIGVLAIAVGVPLMAVVYRGCRSFFAGRGLPRGAVPADGDSIVANRR